MDRILVHEVYSIYFDLCATCEHDNSLPLAYVLKLYMNSIVNVFTTRLCPGCPDMYVGYISYAT